MSWSVYFIGTPQKIADALEAESERISKDPDDQCRREYDAAKPSLIGLVKENFAHESAGYPQPVIQLSASGSGYRESMDGPDRYRSCFVEIKQLSGKLLV